MFYFLSVGQTLQLKSQFGPDNLIVFQSTEVKPALAPGQDNTAIQLLSATGDFILHMSFRLFQDKIVFNAKTAQGVWGAEESVPLAGKFVGTENTITVYDHGDRFQILIDFHTVHYFKKRFQENATGVSYTLNQGQPASLFSDPLAVSTYSSLANVFPRDD